MTTGPGPSTAQTIWAITATAWALACPAAALTAAAVSGLLAGHGWAWPTHPLTAITSGLLAHPGDPAAGWPPGPRPGPAWLLWPLAALGISAVTAALLTAGAIATQLLPEHHTPRNPRNSHHGGPRGPHRGFRGGLRASVGGGFGGGSMDGFAGRDTLRQLSLHAIRDAAPQTRPDLTPTHRRSCPGTDLGIALGRPTTPRAPRRTVWLSWNQMLRIIGPSDWGKTLRILVPLLRDLPGPTIAASTKPDLYELTAPARARRGRIRVLDPQHMAAGQSPVRWSPVRRCHHSHVATKRAAAFMHAALPTQTAARDGNTAFFAASAEQVIACLLHAAALDGRDMRQVLTWACASGAHPEPAAILTHHPGAAPNWAARLHTHLSDAPETSSGVRRNVELALDCFTHADTLHLACPDPAEEFDIDAFLDSTDTIYVLGKPATAGGGIAPLLTAFVEEVLDRAEEHALRQPHRRLDPPLHTVLDEAPSICPLPTLPQRAADGRGRGIWLAYAMQSWAQERQRWGEHGSQTLFDTTAVTLICGGLKDDSLRTFEHLLGHHKTPTTSSSRGPGGTTISTSQAHEPVLTAADIRTLPAGHALLLAGNHPPLIAYQPGIWEHPDWPTIHAEQTQVRAAVEAARAAHDRDQAHHSAGAAAIWRTRRDTALHQPHPHPATPPGTRPAGRRTTPPRGDHPWTT
jgi:type IV secretory pathway TraG/TraD family ATPase VirD4